MMGVAFRGWFAALILCVGATAAADPHKTASRDDYLLKSDITLANGQTVPAGTRWYQPPNIGRLKNELMTGEFKGDAEWAKRVVFGYNLISDTYRTIGEGRTDKQAPLGAGFLINCSSCHAQAGTVPRAWPFFRTITHYGLRENGDPGVPYANLGYHRDTRTRARDCGLECGSVVHIGEASPEMDALVAWLTVVRDGIYPGEGILVPAFKTKDDVGKLPGATIPMFANVLDMKADPVAGGRFFGARCAHCHGQDGKGTWNPQQGFAFPPLAGDMSFSDAGGPLMVPLGAAFIYHNMPLSTPGHQRYTISEQEALNVMAYVAKFPRSKVWWQDYFFEHNPCARPAYLPLHVGATPKGFPFSKEQAQFGPWREIADWLASDACKTKNPPTEPKLKKDFDPNRPL